MTSRKLRFAIFGNTYQPKKSVSVQKILACLSERKADVYVESEFYDFLCQGQHLDVAATKVFKGSDFDADFVISMGGDGTFLRAASIVGDKHSISLSPRGDWRMPSDASAELWLKEAESL